MFETETFFQELGMKLQINSFDTLVNALANGRFYWNVVALNGYAIVDCGYIYRIYNDWLHSDTLIFCIKDKHFFHSLSEKSYYEIFKEMKVHYGHV